MSEEVTDGWRKPHSEKLHNLYSSPEMLLFSAFHGVGSIACSGFTNQFTFTFLFDSKFLRPLDLKFSVALDICCLSFHIPYNCL